MKHAYTYLQIVQDWRLVGSDFDCPHTQVSPHHPPVREIERRKKERMSKDSCGFLSHSRPCSHISLASSRKLSCHETLTFERFFETVKAPHQRQLRDHPVSPALHQLLRIYHHCRSVVCSRNTENKEKELHDTSIAQLKSIVHLHISPRGDCSFLFFRTLLGGVLKGRGRMAVSGCERDSPAIPPPIRMPPLLPPLIG